MMIDKAYVGVDWVEAVVFNEVGVEEEEEPKVLFERVAMTALCITTNEVWFTTISEDQGVISDGGMRTVFKYV